MVIDFATAYATIPGDGWLTEAEARLLYSAACYTTGPILEVGCFKGRSTCLLAALGRDMYVVDKFRDFSDSESAHDIYVAFIRNIASRGFQNVQLYVTDIAEWPVRPVGFAYLDGDHSAEGTEIQIVRALAAGAKVIAIHDVADGGGGKIVRDVAVGILGTLDKRVERMAVWNVSELAKTN